jgi:hypothetical protein
LKVQDLELKVWGQQLKAARLMQVSGYAVEGVGLSVQGLGFRI